MLDQLKRMLDAYERACDIPENIPQMLSWMDRKDEARQIAVDVLDLAFTPGQLRSLHDLTAHMLADELAAEQEA